MAFQVGKEVEVKGRREEGFALALYGGMIVDVSPGRCKVRYFTLVNDQNVPLEEVIHHRRLRPPSPNIVEDFQPGDIVDAWHNEGWWTGRYLGLHEGHYMVEYDEEVEGVRLFGYPRPNIRHHAEWISETSCWIWQRRYGG